MDKIGYCVKCKLKSTIVNEKVVCEVWDQNDEVLEKHEIENFSGFLRYI